MKLKDSIILILVVIIAIAVGCFVGYKLGEKGYDVLEPNDNQVENNENNKEPDKKENLTMEEILKKQKDNLYDTQINLIIAASEAYLAENIFSITDKELENGYSIYLKTLYNKGFFDNKIQNPYTCKNFGQCLEVVIKKIDGKGNYSSTVIEETISKETGC